LGSRVGLTLGLSKTKPAAGHVQLCTAGRRQSQRAPRVTSKALQGWRNGRCRGAGGHGAIFPLLSEVEELRALVPVLQGRAGQSLRGLRALAPGRQGRSGLSASHHQKALRQTSSCSSEDTSQTVSWGWYTRIEAMRAGPRCRVGRALHIRSCRRAMRRLRRQRPSIGAAQGA
jgi:hypothetical protein